MSAHVNRCAQCGKLTEGATYYRHDAPRNPSGTIERNYRDNEPPTFCSEECRSDCEATA